MAEILWSFFLAGQQRNQDDVKVLVPTSCGRKKRGGIVGSISEAVF